MKPQLANLLPVLTCPPWARRRYVSGETTAVVAPLLAVIIPVYATTQQHVALLQRALRHLSRQEGCPPAHVVLVDDASPRSLNVSYAGGGQVLPAPTTGLPVTGRPAPLP